MDSSVLCYEVDSSFLVLHKCCFVDSVQFFLVVFFQFTFCCVVFGSA